jgi:hypothetical protein
MKHAPSNATEEPDQRGRGFDEANVLHHHEQLETVQDDPLPEDTRKRPAP